MTWKSGAAEVTNTRHMSFVRGDTYTDHAAAVKAWLADTETAISQFVAPILKGDPTNVITGTFVHLVSQGMYSMAEMNLWNV